MDSPELDPSTYARILNDLCQVNSWTLARPPTINFLAQVRMGEKPAVTGLSPMQPQ